MVVLTIKVCINFEVLTKLSNIFSKTVCFLLVSLGHEFHSDLENLYAVSFENAIRDPLEPLGPMPGHR